MWIWWNVWRNVFIDIGLDSCYEIGKKWECLKKLKLILV